MKVDNARLFAAVDAAAQFQYHKIYTDLGLRQSKSGNFHCPNTTGHSDGRDDNASLSINKETGQYKCHCCSVKGNLNTMYKEFIANSPADRWGNSYRRFAIDYFNLRHLDEDDEISGDMLKQLKELDINKLVRPLDPTPKKDIQYIPTERNDEFVNILLGNPKLMDYVREARNWDEKTITKYRIGYSDRDNAFTFPLIDVMGRIPNIKLYRPWKKEGEPYKWQAYVAGNPILPSPLVHLTHNKIYIFEGEPDCYMAAAHGLYGITSGSASNFDYKKIFGDAFANTFKDKEIVIVCDADATGEKAAKAMALQFVEVARQVKIIDLNKSDACPTGLDPQLTHEYNGKLKRNEKDVTDFFRKNGFGENALNLFMSVESNTKAFTDDRNRKARQLFKVKLDESVHSKYFDNDGNTHLEIVANVSDVDDCIYKFPTQLCVSCKPLYDITMKNNNMCKKCRISNVDGFGDQTKKEVVFDLVCNSDRKALGVYEINVSEYRVLEMIQTGEKSRNIVRKKILDIPERCSDCVIDELAQKSIQHVSLIKDMEETAEEGSTNRNHRASATDKPIEAFFVGEALAVDSIIVNKCYRIKAVQTRTPGRQGTALFCYDVFSQQDSFESFEMNDEMAELLKVFRPEPNQTIGGALGERYRVLSGAAGINGREDVFFLCDLAFFSPIELRCPKVLPSVTRGWVEILIAGDTRCGKSIVSEFLYNHYRVGEFIGGGKAITVTGLLGGITQSFDKSKISWGKFPQNDRGVVVIDELSCISPEHLQALTDMRSSGIAEIEKIVRGRAAARVRKIFMSNWRESQEGDVNRHDYGIQNIRKLCVHDAVISRFDAAIVLRNTDVLNFDANYEKVAARYTSYQCRNLIFWAYSRLPNQIKLEDGFSKALNDGQAVLMEKFHPHTQLVNQEMRAKLCRMAISLATMLFSSDGDDYNVIFVKCEHVRYIVTFLMRIYGPRANIGLYEYSEELRRNEQLGNMKFMMNILKHVDMDSILSFKEGNEKDIMCMFADYLLRVTRGELFIVDGKSDRRTTSWKSYELNDKFIGLLKARNCFTKTRFNKLRKTDAFAEWLRIRKEQGDAAEQSDILENDGTDTGFSGGYIPKDLGKSN